jgi:hypothetical protein
LGTGACRTHHQRVTSPVILAPVAMRQILLAHVILSEAKDLTPVASGDEVLRFAQDDGS